jgi:hypothetical protein
MATPLQPCARNYSFVSLDTSIDTSIDLNELNTLYVCARRYIEVGS